MSDWEGLAFAVTLALIMLFVYRVARWFIAHPAALVVLCVVAVLGGLFVLGLVTGPKPPPSPPARPPPPPPPRWQPPPSPARWSNRR